MNFAFTCPGFLTTYTPVGVFLYIRLDVRPPVVPGDEFLGFIAAWVSSCYTIVMGSYDVFVKSLVSWDIESFLPLDFA